MNDMLCSTRGVIEMNIIFDSLLEMSGKKKGLVEFADGTVVICDWSPLDGSPRLAVGSMSGSANPIEVETEMTVPGWKIFAEDAASLVNCLGLDLENEDDCEARIFNLSDDISVIVPLGWSGDEKAVPVPDAAECSVSFCTCKDTACRFHPVNHNEGCTPCIEANLKGGEIPSCFVNQAGLERRREGYLIEDFAAAVLKKER